MNPRINTHGAIGFVAVLAMLFVTLTTREHLVYAAVCMVSYTIAVLAPSYAYENMAANINKEKKIYGSQVPAGNPPRICLVRVRTLHRSAARCKEKRGMF